MSGRGDERIEVALERLLARGPTDFLGLIAGLRKIAGPTVARQEGSLHGFLYARLRKEKVVVVGRSPRGLALYAAPDTRSDTTAFEPPLPGPLDQRISKTAIRTASGVRDPAERGRATADLVAHLESLRESGSESSFGHDRVARTLLTRADRGRPAVFFKAGLAGALRRVVFHEGPWIVGAVVLFFVLRTFVGEVFQIPSESMRPTLEPGDRVIVLKHAQGEIPERWSVVVFRHFSALRDAEIAVVKRLVGLPGEKVAIFQGDVFIDGSVAVKPDFAREALRLPKSRWSVVDGTLIDWDKGISHDEVTWALRRYPVLGDVYYHKENRPPLGSEMPLFDGYLVHRAERPAGSAASATISRGRVGMDDGAVEWTLTVEDGRAVLTETRGVDVGVEVLHSASVGPAAGRVSLELAYVDGIVRARIQSGGAHSAFEVARPAEYLPLALRVGTRGDARTVDIVLDQDVHYSHQHQHGVPTQDDAAAGRLNPHPVPAGHVFFLGDNTRDSTDSRSRHTGDIPVGAIVGKVRIRIWPPARIGQPR